MARCARVRVGRFFTRVPRGRPPPGAGFDRPRTTWRSSTGAMPPPPPPRPGSTAAAGGKATRDALRGLALQFETWDFVATRDREAARRRETSDALDECLRTFQLCASPKLTRRENVLRVLPPALLNFSARLLARVGRVLDRGVARDVDRAVRAVADAESSLGGDLALDAEIERRARALASDLLSGWKGEENPGAPPEEDPEGADPSGGGASPPASSFASSFAARAQPRRRDPRLVRLLRLRVADPARERGPPRDPARPRPRRAPHPPRAPGRGGLRRSRRARDRRVRRVGARRPRPERDRSARRARRARSVRTRGAERPERASAFGPTPRGVRDRRAARARRVGVRRLLSLRVRRRRRRRTRAPPPLRESRRARGARVGASGRPPRGTPAGARRHRAGDTRRREAQRRARGDARGARGGARARAAAAAGRLRPGTAPARGNPAGLARATGFIGVLLRTRRSRSRGRRRSRRCAGARRPRRFARR